MRRAEAERLEGRLLEGMTAAELRALADVQLRAREATIEARVGAAAAAAAACFPSDTAAAASLVAQGVRPLAGCEDQAMHLAAPTHLKRKRAGDVDKVKG